MFLILLPPQQVCQGDNYLYKAFLYLLLWMSYQRLGIVQECQTSICCAEIFCFYGHSVKSSKLSPAYCHNVLPVLIPSVCLFPHQTGQDGSLHVHTCNSYSQSRGDDGRPSSGLPHAPRSPACQRCCEGMQGLLINDTIYDHEC